MPINAAIATKPRMALTKTSIAGVHARCVKDPCGKRPVSGALAGPRAMPTRPVLTGGVCGHGSYSKGGKTYRLIWLAL